MPWGVHPIRRIGTEKSAMFFLAAQRIRSGLPGAQNEPPGMSRTKEICIPKDILFEMAAPR
jgi:hypothetical protein